METVLTELAQQVDASNITKFNVICTNLFESANQPLNRKKFDPCYKIFVKFMDDVGSFEVDLGGGGVVLNVNFLRCFCTVCFMSLPSFLGTNTPDIYISLSQKSFQGEDYRLIVELVALSLVHGGPVLRCLSGILFQSLVSGVVQGIKLEMSYYLLMQLAQKM